MGQGIRNEWTDWFYSNDSQFNIYPLHRNYLAWISQSVKLFATDWTVRGSNQDGGDIFCAHPDQPWGPHSFLYNEQRSFPGVKRQGRCLDHQSLCSAEVKERVQLYLYSPHLVFMPFSRAKFIRIMHLKAFMNGCHFQTTISTKMELLLNTSIMGHIIECV